MTLWKPDARRIESANMTRFMKAHGHSTYQRAYEWSITRPEEFWPAVWKFAELKASAPWTRVCDDVSKMPGARWFEGARLNFAENLLRFSDDRIALSSNLHPAGFDELMPKTLATATVDRLLHHAHICQTSGDSIRLTQALDGKGVQPLT